MLLSGNWIAHGPFKVEDGGSNPSGSTTYLSKFQLLRQYG